MIIMVGHPGMIAYCEMQCSTSALQVSTLNSIYIYICIYICGVATLDKMYRLAGSCQRSRWIFVHDST